MNIMDHAINALKSYLEPVMDWLRDEYKSGDFEKFSDCPSYFDAQALVQAIHVLEKAYYEETKTLSVEDLVGC